MRLAQSTLTGEERITEAKRHVTGLMPNLSKMTDREKEFVQAIADNLQRYGDKTEITPKHIFWLRDLTVKY